MKYEFLEIEDVHGIHEESLRRYGGATGLREPGLLDSSLAAALNTFLYTGGDEFDIAAHRTPVIERRLYDAMIAIAKHELDKAGLAALFRELFR